VGCDCLGSPRRLGLLLPSNPLSGNLNALSVAFSSDGRTLAVGTDNGTVVLWDLATSARSGTTRYSVPAQSPMVAWIVMNGTAIFRTCPTGQLPA
jgi:WD40 repeat protein